MSSAVKCCELAISGFDEVLADFRAGRMVIISDAESRENEGDLCVAAEKVSAEALAFMMRHGRGLICVSILEERAEELNLPLQVSSNKSRFGTPFAVSIDLREHAALGVSASARADTIRRLVDVNARPDDFVAPGHVFPLIANPAGVIGRQGQTEGSLDLARLAGLAPSGVICEVLNPDGTMARAAELNSFSMKHGVKITTVQEIIRHRVRREILVRKTAEDMLDTDHGPFKVYVFRDDVEEKEHLALVYAGDAKSDSSPLVRVHSECLTGDVFGSRRCDCGQQLDGAMRMIAAEGQGAILYLQQEGRGIGLLNKLKAYALQDEGHDTVEANIKLGFPADLRDFGVAAKMLQALGMLSVRLITNNPRKLHTLAMFGIEIVRRIPVVIKPDEFSSHYLATKREKLGHWI